MLLRRITQHLKEQNWFAVGLDFFIVVAGILIAFQITNWSETRRAQANLAEAETALQIDLYYNYVNSQERLSLVDCRIAHLGELAARLLKPGDKWEGMARYDSDNAGAVAIEPVLRSPSRNWGSRIWEAELARGTFNQMDAARRQTFDSMFKQADVAEKSQIEIIAGQTRLKVLSNTLDLSRAERLRYYDVVAEIDANSYYLETVASQIAASIETLGIDIPIHVRNTLQEEYTESMNSRIAIYGECVKPLSIPFIEAPDVETT